MLKFIADMFAGPTSDLVPEPKPAEVNEAYRKVDRILDTAFLPSHVDAAENMFGNLLNRFKFSHNDRQSPLVIGMQEKINIRRDEVIAQWERMHNNSVTS